MQKRMDSAAGMQLLLTQWLKTLKVRASETACMWNLKKMAQKNLFTKQTQKQTYGVQWGEVGRYKLGDWN